MGYSKSHCFACLIFRSSFRSDEGRGSGNTGPTDLLLGVGTHHVDLALNCTGKLLISLYSKLVSFFMKCVLHESTLACGTW